MACAEAFLVICNEGHAMDQSYARQSSPLKYRGLIVVPKDNIDTTHFFLIPTGLPETIAAISCSRRGSTHASKYGISRDI